MDYLALTLPGGEEVYPPGGVPSSGISYLDEYLRTGLTTFIFIAIILCLVSIIWFGYKWLFSNEKKAKTAYSKSRMMGSSIGFMIAFSTYVILSYIFKLR